MHTYTITLGHIHFFNKNSFLALFFFLRPGSKKTRRLLQELTTDHPTNFLSDIFILF